MPRKNARPAARKRRAELKAKVAARKAGKPLRYSAPSPAPDPSRGMALAAAAAFGLPSRLLGIDVSGSYDVSESANPRAPDLPEED